MQFKSILFITALALAGTSLQSKAQVTNTAQDSTETSDDLMNMLDDAGKDGNASKHSYTTATFKGTRVINGHSIETVGKGVLDFRISHRFGELNGGAHQFFGLDAATTRIGFDYGITNWLMIGIGRSSYEKEYDGFVKAKILRQTDDGHMPLSLNYVGGLSVSDRDKPTTLDSTQKYHFSNRMYFFNQLLIARKFNGWLSLQLMPTHVHYNLVQKSSDPNDIFALGVAGRVKLNRRFALTGEYYYVLNPIDGYYNSLSFGVDIETGGHVFQLHFTNSRGMTERTFVGQTDGQWGDGDIHFGFNISRVFTIVRPKDFRNSQNKIW
jgi:hypothetical protein